MGQKIYYGISTIISSILAYHSSLKESLIFFIIVIILDSITRIHADSKNKGLKFNPFKLYFWKQIKSKGLRRTLEKVFLEYGIYLIIAFTLDKYILDKMVIFHFNEEGLTLPILTIWLFCFIEIWSIAENIEEAGGKNVLKIVYDFLPEKIKKILDGIEENSSDNRAHKDER